MGIDWVTAEQVLAAKAAFEEAMPGWEHPVAYALGVSVDDGPIDWRVVNHPNTHQLPGVVLGTVLGHRSGSATYWLDSAQFEEAIRLLEPAGACAAFEHPNLWAWQQVRAEIQDGSLPESTRVVAVFIGDLIAPNPDGPQRALRSVLGTA